MAKNMGLMAEIIAEIYLTTQNFEGYKERA
jgi:hypothetical protein